MTTQRLYYNNPYQIEFNANVSSIVDVDGKTGIILDRTAFYPTSGGQPHDLGTLNNYTVVDVIEEGDIIIHVIAEEYKGEQQLRGRIDWARRFDHMQQHAGQHILSAVIREAYGWETVGFHLGNEYVTIDVTTAEEIPFVELENKVYDIILRNLPIETHFQAREQLDAYVVRKVPAEETYIRIVEIPDIDINACCGTHPNRTAEVGLVKLLQTELVRGQRRIYFVAGWRALELFQQEHHSIGRIAASFKISHSDLEARLQLLKEEHEQVLKDNRRISQELIQWEALDWQKHYRQVGPYRYYMHVWADRPFQDLKDLAKTIIEQDQSIVIFATKAAKTQVVLACSQDVPISMMELAQQLATLLNGRGGGSRVFAQVGGEAEHLETALTVLDKRLSEIA